MKTFYPFLSILLISIFCFNYVSGMNEPLKLNAVISDDCSNPTLLDVPADCEYHSFSGSSYDSDPFPISSTTCNYDNTPVVFFQLNIPEGDPLVTDISIEITDGNLYDPMFAVLSYLNCDDFEGEAAAGGSDGNNSCITDGLVEDIPVTAGRTYYVLVGSQSGAEADFSIRVKYTTPPENDNPCINATHNPPYNLNTGGHTGTTCCARGPNDVNQDGSTADFTDQLCNGANEENAVWYTYAVNEENEGYDLSFSGTNMTLEGYWGVPDAGCTGAFSAEAAILCLGGGEFKIPNCPPSDGDILHFKVSSTDANCGSFTIEVYPAACLYPSADVCDLAENIGTTITAECSDTPEPIIVSGCLTYACSDTILEDCGFGEMPVVWFQVSIDENAPQLVVQIPDYDWNPVYGVYQGNDCDHLEIIAGGTIDEPVNCGGGENANPSTHSVAVDFNMFETYWIAVGAANLMPGEEAEFELTVFTTLGCVSCIGDFACGDQVAEWSIEERSSDRDLDDQEFCPGEEVRVCFNMLYDATSTREDWLHGITPSFGQGWDAEASGIFTEDGPANTVNMGPDGDPVWFDADPACVMATEDFPYVATYADSQGNLRVCNLLCGNCPPGIEPLESGEPLPGGWYWNTEACSGSLDCPSSGYGIGSTPSDIQLCFDMVVRSDIDGDCTEEERDLNISILTTSDGVTGCWNDPIAECLLDPMQIGPAWAIECITLPPVDVVGETNINSGDTLDIDLFVSDGSTLDIYIFVNDNPSVSGDGVSISSDPDNPTVFNNGIATIEETLINDTTIVQEVKYFFYAVDYSIDCPSPLDSLIVYVSPEVMGDHQVCYGDTLDIQLSAAMDETIEVYVDSSDAVVGEGVDISTDPDNPTIFGNTAMISEVLLNTSGADTQVNYYYRFRSAEEEAGEYIVLKIDVYLELMVEVDDYSICQGQGILINPTIEDNNLGDLVYQWEDEAGVIIGNESSIFLNFGGLYILEVTDVQGCQGKDTFEVVFLSDAVDFIPGEEYIMCAKPGFDASDPLYVYEFMGDGSNYEILEVTPSGLVYNRPNSTSIAFDHSTSTPGSYSVIVEGTLSGESCNLIDTLHVMLLNSDHPSCVADCGGSVDYQALRSLYLATNGDNWDNNNGWPEASAFMDNIDPPAGTDYGSWYGITCIDGRVTCIDLDGMNDCESQDEALGNNLRGFLPEELGTLDELVVLNLSFNHILDEIPESIASLSKLEVLDMKSNGLDGEIPSVLRALTKLRVLNLSRNQLEGELPLWPVDLEYLETLDLGENKHTGSLPIAYTTMPEIERLRLDFNFLTGCIPVEYLDLCYIDHLDFSYNIELPWEGRLHPFCETDEDQIGAPCRDNFSFNGVDVIDDNCDCVPMVQGIAYNDTGEYLALRDLYLETDGDNWIINTGWPTAAEFLDNPLVPEGLNLNAWYGVEVSEGGEGIEVLNFNGLFGKNTPKVGNNMVGSLNESLGNLTHLKELHIAKNNLVGGIPEGIFDLGKLKVIDVSDNKFSSELPEKLSELAGVEIDLSGNDYFGCIPISYSVFCEEGSLSLSENDRLPWLGDFTQFCDSERTKNVQIDAPCDDGNEENGTDNIIKSCDCEPITTSILDIKVDLFTHRNIPNPFTHETSILVQSTISTDVQVLIQDVTGKIVYRRDHRINQGKNTILIDGEEFNQRGMLIYQLISKDYHTNGKMIRI